MTSPTLSNWANGVFNIAELVKEGAVLGSATVLRREFETNEVATNAFQKLVKTVKLAMVSAMGSRVLRPAS